jgi:hypothetical protein
MLILGEWGDGGGVLEYFQVPTKYLKMFSMPFLGLQPNTGK